MDKWLRGLRGTLLVIVLWVVGWGMGFGGLAELLIDPSGEIEDIWPAEMAIPGFFGGLIFVALVWAVDGLREPARTSIAHLTVCGAITGLVLGVLTTTTGGPVPFPATTAEMLGITTGLGANAGLGTAVFFLLVTKGPASLVAGRSG